MIERDDLRAGVAAGIVTEAQAARLAALADARRGARSDLAPGDEPFELFKGFNEIFIVIGLVILATGWGAVSAVYVSGAFGGTLERIAMQALIGAAVLWLMSEYFIRRRRMVAPAIALSVLWAGNAALGFTAAHAQPFMLAQEDYSSLPWPLALSVVALALYWARFRVPFALAMIALGGFAVALVIAADASGQPTTLADLFLLSGDGPFAWITLALGVVVFVIAMSFDMSDPHRVTRRAANGFWLHVVAAPALVNTVSLTLLSDGGSNIALAAVLVFFAIVALVIDRRSFLIAAVGYSVTLAITVFGTDGAAFTILSLGASLVLLGALWERMRAILLRLLGPVLPLDRLPPAG